MTILIGIILIAAIYFLIDFNLKFTRFWKDDQIVDKYLGKIFVCERCMRFFLVHSWSTVYGEKEIKLEGKDTCSVMIPKDDNIINLQVYPCFRYKQL